ncbi:MAG: pantoate kinase [Candidatus Heimdallarchaeota archaeon]
MILQTQRVIIRVPHRISGFFEIVDEFDGIKINDLERIGSRGAGFNLSSFGKTEIRFEGSSKKNQNSCQIYINNEELNEKAETSHFIYNYLKNVSKKGINIKVFHDFDLPVGCGYGASGSGALGITYGLNILLNLRLSDYEIGRIAHVAEVTKRTGLGTVCGILAGGLCILKEPGYPCNIERIKVPPNIKIICGTFGIIPTKSILSDPILSSRIKQAGMKALVKLKKEPNIKNFVSVSKDFVYETDILNLLKLNKVKELVEDLNKINIIGASMNQLGSSVYAITKKEDEHKVLEIFESFKPDIKIFESTIRERKQISIKKY